MSIIVTFTGIFYYMMGNISPKYRSKVNSIQLLAIVKTKNIKKYSMNAILAPIITDIALLVSDILLVVYIPLFNHFRKKGMCSSSMVFLRCITVQ